MERREGGLCDKHFARLPFVEGFYLFTDDPVLPPRPMPIFNHDDISCLQPFKVIKDGRTRVVVHVAGHDGGAPFPHVGTATVPPYLLPILWHLHGTRLIYPDFAHVGIELQGGNDEFHRFFRAAWRNAVPRM